MRKYFLWLGLNFLVIACLSQSITLKDYERAVSFLYPNLNNKKIFNLNIPAYWAEDSSGVAFITQNKNERSFNKIDFAKMQIEPLLDKERLAKILSDSLKTTIKANDLTLTGVKYVE